MDKLSLTGWDHELTLLHRSCWRGPQRSMQTTLLWRWLCRPWRLSAPISMRPRGRWRSWKPWNSSSPTSRGGRWDPYLLSTVSQSTARPSCPLQCGLLQIRLVSLWQQASFFYCFFLLWNHKLSTVCFIKSSARPDCRLAQRSAPIVDVEWLGTTWLSHAHLYEENKNFTVGASGWLRL